MPRNTKAVVAMILVAALAAPPARGSFGDNPTADVLVIVAHPGFLAHTISTLDLRAIFLGEKSSLKGAGQVRPVLNQSDSQLAEFCTNYLGKNPASLRTYYRSLIFTGKGSTPVSFASDDQVIDYVSRTHGAIGYVRGAAVRKGVRILQVEERMLP